jgi:hypothetical protein
LKKGYVWIPMQAGERKTSGHAKKNPFEGGGNVMKR